MKTNEAKKALKQGKSIIGTMTMEFSSPEMARALAAAGFDFVIIDTEHSSYTLETVTDLIRAGKSLGMDCIVRVPDPLYHLMARTCDAGAQGLMVPRVETVDQVERVVQAVKYPPIGKRGFGVRPIHTNYETMPVPALLERMNEESMIIIQIESGKAVDNIDELLSADHVDVALIGPFDLSIDLKVPGEFEHPTVVEAIEKVIASCNRHDVAAGIHMGSVNAVIDWAGKGMRCLTCSSDLGMLSQAARSNVRKIREGIQ